MSESVQQLQKKSHKELQQAFSTFNHLSVQLEKSYQELEHRVADLHIELHDTQSEYVKELKEKERLANRLESLLKVLPGAVIVLDGFGVVQEYNPAAINLLGEPLSRQVWNDIIQRVFSPKYDDGHEVSLTDGRRVTISTCPLESEPGQILLLTDVTEMHSLHDRLNHHQRLVALGEMAASLAHQVRTPLSSAMLYASTLKNQELSNLDRKHYSSKILKKLTQLDALVNDMLLYSKNRAVNEQDFKVELLIKELCESVNSEVILSNTKLKIKNNIANTSLYGNKEILVSAISNIILNAIQAMGTNGEITLETNNIDNNKILIKITDNGPGINQQDKEQIFDAFYTTRSEGSGLGLAVVNAIVNAHGGNVWVESEIGSGCSFYMQLPCCHARTTSSTRIKDSKYRSTENRYIA